MEVLLYEFKHDLDAYLAERKDPAIRSLEDVIRFNEEHAADELATSARSTSCEPRRKDRSQIRSTWMPWPGITASPARRGSMPCWSSTSSTRW